MKVQGGGKVEPNSACVMFDGLLVPFGRAMTHPSWVATAREVVVVVAKTCMLSKLRSLSLRPARSARSAARHEEKTATKTAASASSARNLTEDQRNRLENWRMSLTPSYRYINADVSCPSERELTERNSRG